MAVRTPLWPLAVALVAVLALSLVSSAPAKWRRIDTRTKAQAERDVLRATPQMWSRKRIAPLIDQRTGLLRNNVHVICRGRGPRFPGRAHQRFVCAIHASPRRVRVRLFVSYRALPEKRFRVRWLYFRRG